MVTAAEAAIHRNVEITEFSSLDSDHKLTLSAKTASKQDDLGVTARRLLLATDNELRPTSVSFVCGRVIWSCYLQHYTEHGIFLNYLSE